jgi:hypothetical protein
MGINYVHEAAHSLYIYHVCNGVVADTFLGDDLFEADKTIQVEERVDNAAKRVHKLTATTKATVGQTGRGGNTYGKCGGGDTVVTILAVADNGITCGITTNMFTRSTCHQL